MAEGLDQEGRLHVAGESTWPTCGVGATWTTHASHHAPRLPTQVRDSGSASTSLGPFLGPRGCARVLRAPPSLARQPPNSRLQRDQEGNQVSHSRRQDTKRGEAGGPASPGPRPVGVRWWGPSSSQSHVSIRLGAPLAFHTPRAETQPARWMAKALSPSLAASPAPSPSCHTSTP